MNHYFKILIILFVFFISNNVAWADAIATTKRISQFSNDKVNVWETIIYPTPMQVLKMHRHEHDRVLVALNNGTLKITNDKGKVHYLKLKKEKAYFLPKDIPDELHNDENITKLPIKVIVIELKN